MLPIEKFGVQDRRETNYRKNGRASARKSVKEEEHFDMRGVKRRGRNENVLARPNGLREKTETAISCRGPGPSRNKKEVYQ